MGEFDNVYRELSDAERYRYLVLDKILSRNVIEGKFDRDIVNSALTNVCKKHPVLQCHIASRIDNSDKPFFMRKNQFDAGSYCQIKFVNKILFDNKKYSDEANLEYLMALNEYLDPKDQLWKILFLVPGEKDKNNNGKFMMILTTHHCITDGNVILFMVKEILNQLEKPGQIVNPFPGKNIIESVPIDKCITAGDKSYYEKVARKFKENKEEKAASTVPRIFKDFQFKVSDSGDAIHFYSDIILEDKFNGYNEVQKKGSIKYNPILTALFIDAVFNEMKDNSHNESVDVVCNVAVNVRALRSKSTSDDQIYVIKKDFWDQIACRACGCRATYNMRTEKEDNIMNLIDEVKENVNDENIWHGVSRLFDISYHKKYNPADYPVDIIVSNIGLLKHNDMLNNKFNLVMTDFTGSTQLPCVTISFTTFKNSLRWIIIYTNNQFRDGFIKKISDSFKQKIDNFFKFYIPLKK